jgi:hypothetical protein
MQRTLGIGQTRIIALVGLLVTAGCANQADPTPPAASVATAEPTTVVGSATVEHSGQDESPAPISDLPLPGARGGPAGEYGWTGTLGAVGGMHHIFDDPPSESGFQTQLTFSVADDCFAYGTDTEPASVTVAGLDGLYVEPYEDPDVTFVQTRASATTGAYALAIGDRTLCLYLTWDPDTTQDELEAARQVVESIRAQPFGPDGIRMNFTLPEGWDTG